MSSEKERQAFSVRLQEALRRAEYTSDSPTQLAREFNIRFSGNPITVHAARKWLVGESIPTQEKLRTLSQWLSVPAEWLRFGDDKADMTTNRGSGLDVRLSPKDLALVESLQRLDDDQREIVRDIIRLLVRMAPNGKKERKKAS